MVMVQLGTCSALIQVGKTFAVHESSPPFRGKSRQVLCRPVGSRLSMVRRERKNPRRHQHRSSAPLVVEARTTDGCALKATLEAFGRCGSGRSVSG